VRTILPTNSVSGSSCFAQSPPHRSPRGQWTALLLGCVLFFATAPVVIAGQASTGSNPFDGIETHQLENGLQVWIKYLPGEPNVSIGVTTRFGSGDDPVGLEELAHFTEHMLFTDHMGRTEEEIKREVEDRGGTRNGFTHVDHTYYYVDIAQEHALFALDWLYRIVSPHEMAPEIVEKQRTPLLVELEARPRGLVDWFEAYYLDPPWSRLPSFWEREFGIETRRSRDYDPYRSLHRITAEDLQWFYQTYYIPAAMTLVISGDFDREALWQKLEDTFATLPARPLPGVEQVPRNPKRRRQTFDWNVRATADYSHGYRFYRVDAQQHMMLRFLRDWLSRRLQRKLRYGERKVTYGTRAHLYQYGSAHYLCIRGDISPGEIDYTRLVVEEELDLLRNGNIPQEDFILERDGLVNTLRTDYVDPSTLTWAVRKYFYNRDIHKNYPNLVEYYDGLTREAVAAFCTRHLIPENENLSIRYPQPISMEVAVVAGLILLWLTLRLARRILLHPIEMKRIRYVARFRVSILYRLLLLILTIAVFAAAGRLAYYGYLYLWFEFFARINNFWIQWALHAIAIVLGALGLWLCLGHVPYKLLVFDDHIRVKHLLYGSKRVSPATIEEVSLLGFREVWLSRRIWRCRLLSLGFLSPGLYVRFRTGESWFFSTRQTAELAEVIGAIRTAGAKGRT